MRNELYSSKPQRLSVLLPLEINLSDTNRLELCADAYRIIGKHISYILQIFIFPFVFVKENVIEIPAENKEVWLR